MKSGRSSFSSTDTTQVDHHEEISNEDDSIIQELQGIRKRKGSTVSKKSFSSMSSSSSSSKSSSTEKDYTFKYRPSVGNPLILNAEELLLEEKQCRFMSKTGRYMVKHVKHKSQKSQRLVSDFFTTFVDMKWRYTLASFTLFFLISWVFFAVLYCTMDPNGVKIGNYRI